MKNFLREMLKCALVGFLLSLTIYCFSVALSSGNFSRTFLPEVNRLVSYHLIQISTPATAASMPIDRVREASSSFWPPYSEDSGHCLFLIIWGLCFVYLLFVKYSESADTCYFKTTKALYYRMTRRELDLGE